MTWRSADELLERGLQAASGDGAADRELARRLFVEAAERGSELAMVMAGLAIERAARSVGEVDAALGWFRRAAERGNPEGAEQLGRMLFDLERWDEARSWLTAAAGRGDVDSEIRLAEMAENGWGCSKDVGAALRTYRRYASTHSAARLQLAWCHYHGVGGDVDVDRARATFEELAERGHPMARYGLACSPCFARPRPKATSTRCSG